ncbi:lasso peptide biosynthesis B2 protein [Mycobacterium sp. Y57]|uniref:lasso peptide biosynthesis B2 protein n=1 Tax=Mycolicibacterium xanthum TaxID=2796469 RepID=UPI001C853641|nr:lasso peptide biosynthesis B2 protein [Mycolicibacterium xanthum]MBX7431198.1 lasso peptide biosynthesis B2 protein [Mycolicibacterium xanthum]
MAWVDPSRHGPGESVLAKQWFVSPHAATAVVEEHLVLLDLWAGEYSVFDRVATRFWVHSTSPWPSRISAEELADQLGAPRTVIEQDAALFIAEQIQAGWLQARPSQPAAATPDTVPRSRPSIAAAWKARLRADRLLKRGFWPAYDALVRPIAVEASPRVPIDVAVAKFAAAENLYPSRDAPMDCLPRSMALARFLRCAGWPAEHVLGVRLYPFEAHAWVELQRTPIHDRTDVGGVYTVINRR